MLSVVLSPFFRGSYSSSVIGRLGNDRLLQAICYNYRVLCGVRVLSVFDSSKPSLRSLRDLVVARTGSSFCMDSLTYCVKRCM